MKKIILSAFALSVVLFSCKKDKDFIPNSNNNIEPLALIINQYDYIGQQHNDGLDFVYNKLLTLKNENLKIYTKEEIQELSNQYTILYYETIKSDNPFQGAHSLINNSYKDMHSQEKLYNENLNLSNELMQLLDDLDVIINNQSLTKNQIVNSIKSLEDNAINILNDNDQRIFFSASTVGRYTIDYWSNNINKWKELFNYETESWWGNAGGADVAGAAGGAAGALVVNVVPVFGQVAYGGAIVGAAVAGSVGSAVYSLWTYFTN